MNRGDVYIGRMDPVEGSEQGGTRPVVIVSRDSINNTREHVVVVPFSSSLRGRRLPSHVEVAPGEGGLRTLSIAKTEHVRAVSKSRLGDRWGRLSHETMAHIEAALRVTLQL